VTARNEVKEAQEVEEVGDLKDLKQKNGGIAAFFDLDGTLVPKPSLEKRFVSLLRYRKLIGFRNYFWWLAEATRLAPRGINPILHANKMYLRGVREALRGGTDILVCLSGHDKAGEKSAARKKETRAGEIQQVGGTQQLEMQHAIRRQAGMAVPLYPEGFDRVAWHAQRGHMIALVSGTLELLAQAVALALLVRLGARGITARIGVCATRLESVQEVWSGRIAGEALFGEAKARAMTCLAAEEKLDLSRCYAYGDSASDKWMLEAVGRPTAVNPSNDLARIARRNGWVVLRWAAEKSFAQSAQRSPSSEEAGETLSAEQRETGCGA